ncbi:ferritin-like domain-containing protein [Massilia sp. W12]|uniref:ferritin-like domain-containing protein n=1 Tax=Massilia sp. W12 TaxID=3126507 RepID=UPI0030D07044
MPELRAMALAALQADSVAAKLAAVAEIENRRQQGSLNIDPQAQFSAPPDIPGRPARPRLVAPNHVPKRAIQSIQGRASTIHAIAHIEFNAINLALDAIWRFAAMPDAYYLDWQQVAREEAFHFSLLQAHLAKLGHAYGDFDAHNALWQMAETTAHDPLARMALAPRTLEARGLDATPALRARLANAGDLEAAAILDIILRDEIGHVAIGNRWFAWLCAQRGLDPLQCWPQLAQAHRAPVLRPPFNLDARRAAGFTEAELELLQQWAANRQPA